MNKSNHLKSFSLFIKQFQSCCYLTFWQNL